MSFMRQLPPGIVTVTVMVDGVDVRIQQAGHSQTCYEEAAAADKT